MSSIFQLSSLFFLCVGLIRTSVVAILVYNPVGSPVFLGALHATICPIGRLRDLSHLLLF